MSVRHPDLLKQYKTDADVGETRQTSAKNDKGKGETSMEKTLEEPTLEH